MRARMVMIVVGAALVLCGCQDDAQKKSAWEFGRAYHTVFESQRLNPEAGDDTPVAGMDGKKAMAIHDLYQRKVLEPLPAEQRAMQRVEMTVK